MRSNVIFDVTTKLNNGTKRTREMVLIDGKFVPHIKGGSNINGPIPSEWQAYVTQSNVGLEVVPHILYDTQTYTDNVTTTLDFFSSIPANEAISNVNPPRVLPNPNSFLIQCISVHVPIELTVTDEGAAAAALPTPSDDVILLINTGILKLTIGSKPYGPWPLFRLPVSSGFKFSAASAAGAEAANLVLDYGITDGPLYSLIPNLLIAPLQQFSVQLSWPGGAVNLLANRTIKVLLDGQLSRAIQ
jgi:hypothetical protein